MTINELLNSEEQPEPLEPDIFLHTNIGPNRVIRKGLNDKKGYSGRFDLEALTLRRAKQVIETLLKQQNSLEERLRLLQAAVEYSNDGISISDMRERDNPIIYVSPKLVELTGYQSDELVGGNWRILYEEEPDEDARLLLQEALSLGKECRTSVRNIRKDGTPFLCEVTLYPLISSEGEITHYVSVMRDESDKQQTDRALQQAQRLDSIGVLAGGIAHDFNNILQGILTQASIAMKKLDEQDPIRNNIEKVHQASFQAADLTRQLLTYAGRGQFDVESLDVNEVIRDTLQLVRSTIPSSVLLEAELSEEPLYVKSDRGQIQQILLNLILNAAESIEKRGQVWLKSSRYQLGSGPFNEQVVQNETAATQLDSKKEYVLLEVEDNGRGMDDEVIQQIFDPFFTTKESGHGLGMSAALGAVHAQNGKIQVESWPSIGSKISVFIPLESVESKTDSAVEAESSLGHDDEVVGNPTILIIDDDEYVRETLEFALQFMGCKTLTAVSGDAGLALFRECWNTVDLVVLDLHMPGMNGEETFVELSKLNQSVRCLFSSGFGLDSAPESFENEFNRIGFLQKPYDLNLLKDRINQILSNSES